MTKLLSKKCVKDLVGLSFAHTARLEKVGKFPRRVKLGDHVNSRAMYVQDEVLNWIEDRITERDNSHCS